jgi:hypothetical protein
MQVIAYGISADYTDQYLRMGEDITIQVVQMFAKLMIRVFDLVYLQSPNDEDHPKPPNKETSSVFQGTRSMRKEH